MSYYEFNKVDLGNEHQFYFDTMSIHLTPCKAGKVVLMQIGVDIEDDGGYAAGVELDEAAINKLIISLREQLHQAKGE